jgi:cob(I)alamin adenosyltransferase
MAIVNADGTLLELRRMDNALLVSVQLAPHKAFSAVALRLPTTELAKAAQPGAELYGIDVNIPNMTLVGGGLPIFVNGVMIGAVGVSGGTVEQDVDVAQAMLAAL